MEFGQKLAFSVVDGFTFIDEQSFDSFNEGVTLISSAKKYHARFGCWPEAILADTIYRNRENLRFCKEHGIRLSGPRLGRPKADELGADREQAYRDSCDRNIVESRNGISKRRYGLNRILSYLSCTAMTEAALVVLAMNALGVCADTRAHFDDLFDVAEHGIKLDGLQEGWQTGGTRKVTRLAFNLWNGCTYDSPEDADVCKRSPFYGVDEIFCCGYQPYFMQAVRLRFPEYAQ